MVIRVPSRSAERVRTDLEKVSREFADSPTASLHDYEHNSSNLAQEQEVQAVLASMCQSLEMHE